MARVPYLERDDLPEDKRPIIDRLGDVFTPPVANIYLAIANAPDLLEPVVGMARALRRTIIVDRTLRELSVVMVGLLTKSDYEFIHHWNEAIKLGIPREKLEALADFETSPHFNDNERAVLRFARAITMNGVVSEPIWSDLRTRFSVRECVELQMIVAWYNCVVRILLPLEIDLEDWFVRL
jgi:alkylhydroperoxidase family enzyme